MNKHKTGLRETEKYSCVNDLLSQLTINDLFALQFKA